ncbi:MAG: hypothetical protein R3Y04_02130 [Rikenellaceae bacterium]
MNKFIEIFMIVLLVALFGVSSYFISIERSEESFETIEINIKDADSIKFITKAMIEELISSDSIKKLYSNYGDCKLFEIEQAIEQLEYVKNARIYKDIQKKMTIDINQQNIVVRLLSDKGNECYISDNKDFIATCDNFACDVPIVTLSDSLFVELKKMKKSYKKDEKNSFFTYNLLNFVKLVESDKLWKNMIVQINLNDNDEIELIPRVGLHKVVLCDIQDFDKFDMKIDKLKGFYNQIVSKNGWSRYSLINLKYDNLIVATKIN